jgi:hypothetical protein
MSMNATFVQVDTPELAKFQADPSSVEALFLDDPAGPSGLVALTTAMQDRVGSAAPRMLADALLKLDPVIRKELEERLGRTTSALAAGDGGDEILKMMHQRHARAVGTAAATGKRAVLSLDKNWHGVHYVLCGKAEPGPELVSQAVMGGVELGEDEGFSGYGPPRYFTASQVTKLSQVLNQPGLESKAAARFDATRMSKLGIYPGRRSSDAEGVMDSLRRLRDFYADTANKGKAIITCLV